MKLKLFILAFTSLLLVSDILAGQDLPQHSIALEVSDFSEKMLTLSCLLYTSPSPRDRQKSRMPSSA